MVRRKSYFVAVMLVALMSMAEVPSWAKGSDHMLLAKKVDRDGMEAIYEQLQLTAEQKELLEANRQKHHSQMKASRDNVRTLKQSLSNELEKPAFDSQAVQSLKNQLEEAQSQFNDLRLQGIMGVREILTPEQYEQFYEMTR